MAHCSYNFIAVFLVSILHILASPSVIPKNTRISLRLVNRNTIFPDQSFSDDDISAPLMPSQTGTIFMVNVSIGDPPVPQLLAMDTGSHLVWVRCYTTTTCDGCYNTFDPDKSSTYADIPFNGPPCTTFDYSLVEEEDISPCSYGITYADSSYSRGFLALERYTFVTSSEGTAQVPDAVLGCALQTKPPDFGGILGLVATTEYHFVARTGNKFSYCIGNISDPQYMYHKLILGDGAIIQGDSTPMLTRHNHYVVSLEGISVGDKQLSMIPHDFYYSVIIDSGTTYTTLRSSAYKSLEAEVTSLVDRVLSRVKVINAEENQLCYEGDPERDLKGFPAVTLHFAEGADIVLDAEGVFRRTTSGSAFCMAIIESEENVIGIVSQQYYNVGFDVASKKVSFQRIECELLED